MEFATWFANEEAFLAYDQYDIWQIDPEGKKEPVCVTNGYGRKHKIVFRIYNLRGRDESIPQISRKLILYAFNQLTKNEGFFKVTLGRITDPEMLSMDPCSYKEIKDGVEPLVSQNGTLHVVKRESANNSPNYFITSNFKKFDQLTAVYPEKNYNWLTSELMTF